MRRNSLAARLLLILATPGVCTAQTTIQVPSDWTRVERILNGPPPEVLFQGLPFIHPRGIMMNAAQTAVYVGDPGDLTHPCRVIVCSVVGDSLGPPSILYSDPGVLVSAKWVYPTQVNGSDCLIVADQGESDSAGTFTGVGAKVFRLPLLPTGAVGMPEMIWSGAPLKCPTGIAQIGDFGIITDPCAGPMMARADAPNDSFPGSVLFAVKLDGSQAPTPLYQGSPFTSMIGVCTGVPGRLLVNDTDAGRLDPTGSGGRPGFAPPAGAEKFIFDIVNPQANPPTLANLHRQPIYEEGPLELAFGNFSPNAQFVVEMVGDAWIVDRTSLLAPRKRFEFSAVDLDPQGHIVLTVNSSSMEDSVAFSVTHDFGVQTSYRIPKIITQGPILMDNKHAGSKPSPTLLYNRFTVDKTGIWVYPEEGEVPVRIAAGGVVNDPLSGQFAPSGTKFWVVDKTNASLYRVAYPDDATMALLFPFRGKFPVTGVPESAPKRVNRLSQNRPNPFNPQTSIIYSLSVPGRVTVRVYDFRGRCIRTLVAEDQASGEHRVSWDGTVDRGETATSGVYFCRISYPDGTWSAKKMVLIR